MHTLAIVQVVHVSHVEFVPVLLSVHPRKREPVVQVNGPVSKYKFDLDDAYPASFWKQREGKPVMIMSTINDPEEREEYGDLTLHAVIDLGDH